MIRRLATVTRIGRTPFLYKNCDFHFHLTDTLKPKKMDPVAALKDLGYAFNSDGQLRKLNKEGQPGEDPFQFNISNVHQECQAHYEKLGEAVTNYVYHLLETECHLTKLPVPKPLGTGILEPSKDGTFIFASEEYVKKDTLAILIHGSGAVRAGQWARSLIINDNLDMGTQIPYIKKALAKNYGVIVLNTNDNCLPNGKTIKNSGTAEEHGYYVWNKYILKAQAENIVIVAHSYGGVVTARLADYMKEDFEGRVKAIAFTDSVHGYSDTKLTDFIKKVTRNWISSTSPLDTPIKTPDFDVPRFSAGHQKHEMTSHSCRESVFKFIEEKLSEQ